MESIVEQGEEGIVNEGIQDNGDPLAIISGSKPIFDAEILSWDENGEPDFKNNNPNLHDKVRIVLAKNDKFYQRGLVNLSIGGNEVNVSIDALMSCVYSVYDARNPFEKVSDKPVMTAYSAIRETKVKETKEAPAHLNKELLALSLEEKHLKEFVTKKSDRIVKMVLSIEHVEEL